MQQPDTYDKLLKMLAIFHAFRENYIASYSCIEIIRPVPKEKIYKSTFAMINTGLRNI